MTRKTFIRTTAVLGLALGASQSLTAPAGAAPVGMGPLRLVDQTPTQLLFLQHFPDVAEPAAPETTLLHWNTAVTNTIIVKERGDLFERTNIEMIRSVLDVRRGLFPGLEGGVEIPFLYIYGGFLDGFVRSVERTFGAERITRKRDPDERFVYRVERWGWGALVEGEEDTFGLGDASIKLKARLTTQGSRLPAISARTSLKFPTGDTSRALGSGKMDWGAGLLVEKTFGDWTLYANGDVIVPGDAFPEQEVTLRPFFAGMGAAEYRAFETLSVVAQVRTDTLAIFRKQVTDVLLGLNWAPTPDLDLQFGVAEDVLGSAAYSADVSLFLNATRRW